VKAIFHEVFFLSL